MKLRAIIYFCLLTCMAALPVQSNAATYKWTDENGNTVYSQTPPDQGDYTVIEKKSAVTNKYTKPEPQTYTPPATPADSNKDGGADKQIAEETAKSEEIRAQNCELAKKNLEKYTAFRRFVNDKGEVERIDDNVRLQKIEESKQAIKDFCD